MDLAAGRDYITKAVAINAESMLYAQNIQAEIDQEMRRFRERQARTTGIQAIVVNMRKLFGAVFQRLFSDTEQIITLVRLAMQAEQVVALGDQCWQMALICLASEQKTLRECCQGEARSISKRSRYLKRAWSPAWDARCNELMDQLDDLMETVSLGLNPEVKTELQERIANVTSLQHD